MYHFRHKGGGRGTNTAIRIPDSGTSPRSEGLFCSILRFIKINNFRNIFSPLQSVYHSNINTILVAVGVKLCPKGVSTRITYLLATSFAARLGDLLRPQRLKLRASSLFLYVTPLYERTTIQRTFRHSYTSFNQSQYSTAVEVLELSCQWLKNV